MSRIMSKRRAAVLRNHPLKQWREDRQISRPAFGQMCFEAGGTAPHKQTLSGWEACEHFAAPEFHEALIAVIGKPTFDRWQTFHDKHYGNVPK